MINKEDFAELERLAQGMDIQWVSVTAPGLGSGDPEGCTVCKRLSDLGEGSSFHDTSAAYESTRVIVTCVCDAASARATVHRARCPVLPRSPRLGSPLRRWRGRVDLPFIFTKLFSTRFVKVAG